jgi:hypothetical protein
MRGSAPASASASYAPASTPLWRVPTAALLGPYSDPRKVNRASGSRLPSDATALSLAIQEQIGANRPKPRVDIFRQNDEEHWPDGIDAINRSAAYLYANAIRRSTQSSYGSAWNGWEFFCTRYCMDPLRATEDTFIQYATWSSTRVQSSSIKQYLSAIRSQIADWGIALQSSDEMPRLKRILRGLEAVQDLGKEGRVRCPITGEVMRRLKATFSFGSANETMLWAAYCIAFFGWLRPSEFSSRQTRTKGLSQPLRSSAITQSTATANNLVLQLPVTKTSDHAVNVVIGRGADGLCAIDAFSAYQADLRSRLGDDFRSEYLFHFEGRPAKPYLCYEDVLADLRSRLERIGLDASSYAAHSWRIGAATSASCAGLAPHLIKAMGRWKSNAFELYIQPDLQTRANVAATLANYKGTPCTFGGAFMALPPLDSSLVRP